MEVQQKQIEYLQYRKPNRKRKRRYQTKAQPQPFIQGIFTRNLQQPVINLCSDSQSIVNQQQHSQKMVSEELDKQKQLQEIPHIQGHMQIEQEQKQIIKLLQKVDQKQKQSKMVAEPIELEKKIQQDKRQLKDLPQFQQQKSLPSNIYQHQVAVFFHQCKISLSTRPLNGFPSPDVLLIPFITSQLQYYPGTLFKEELLPQRQKLSKAQIANGGIYIKNKLGLYNFKIILFLKTQIEELQKNISDGLSMFLKRTRKDGKQIKTIVFCLDQRMQISQILTGLSMSNQIKNHKNLQFHIIVRDQMTFKHQVKLFIDFTLK